jgi:hypothetical protein
MTIKIGGQSYATRRPTDLDAQLVGATGLNASEHARVIAGDPLASQVATAVRPFLGKDAPSVPELASAIAADDFDRIRGEVVALYGEPAEAPAAPATEKKNG